MPSQRVKRSLVVGGACAVVGAGLLVYWVLSNAPQRAPDDPSCPESRVVFAEEGSELPARLDRCHYERAVAEATVSLHGPSHVTHGPVVIWRELAFDEPSKNLAVGVLIAPLPNLFGANLYGPRVRLVVESVTGLGGREIIDPDGPMMGEDVAVAYREVLADGQLGSHTQRREVDDLQQLRRNHRAKFDGSAG